jgi:DNA polymerase III sliding clamp (beta) subunit (PCNA family)
MDLTITPTDLRPLLQAVMGAVPRHHPSPAGRAIVLSASVARQTLTLTTGQPSLGVEVSATAQVRRDGTTALSSSLLKNLWDTLDDELPVTLTSVQGLINLAQGRSHFRLLTVDTALLALPPRPPSGPATLTIDRQQWCDALAFVLPAGTPDGGTEPPQSPLRSLAITLAQGEIHYTGASRRWLARASWPHLAATEEAVTYLLPLAALRATQRLWQLGEDPIQVTLHDERWLSLTSESARCTVVLGQEAFPDITRLLPDPTAQWEGPRDELLRTARRLRATFSDEAVPALTLDWPAPGTGEPMLRTAEGSEAPMPEGERRGAGERAVLNADLMIQCLQGFFDDTPITVGLTAPERHTPVQLHQITEDGVFLALAMPLALPAAT